VIDAFDQCARGGGKEEPKGENQGSERPVTEAKQTKRWVGIRSGRSLELHGMAKGGGNVYYLVFDKKGSG